VGDERAPILRRISIGLVVIVLIAVSAAIGLLIANWPECVRYLGAGH